MSAITAILRGDLRSVGHDDSSRYQAVQALLRPAEVQPLFRPGTLAERMVPVPERIGTWMCRMFATNALRYMRDPAISDWWQAPSYTLQRGGGDCEDLALLALSMLKLQEVPAVLVTGTCHGAAHAWVEGRDPSGAFLVEATSGQVFRHVRPASYAAISAFGGNFYQRLAA